MSVILRAQQISYRPCTLRQRPVKLEAQSSTPARVLGDQICDSVPILFRAVPFEVTNVPPTAAAEDLYARTGLVRFSPVHI